MTRITEYGNRKRKRASTAALANRRRAGRTHSILRLSLQTIEACCPDDPSFPPVHAKLFASRAGEENALAKLIAVRAPHIDPALMAARSCRSAALNYGDAILN
jgi:hypothetical protein